MNKKIENRLIAIFDTVNFDYVEQGKKEFRRKELKYWSKFFATLIFMLVVTYLISNQKGIF